MFSIRYLRTWNLSLRMCNAVCFFLSWPETSSLTVKEVHIGWEVLGKLRAGKSAGLKSRQVQKTFLTFCCPDLVWKHFPPPPSRARFVPGFFPEVQVAGAWRLPLPLVPRLRVSGAVPPLLIPVAAQSEAWLCWNCQFQSRRGHGCLLWVLCVVR